jgi:hypothetical protein
MINLKRYRDFFFDSYCFINNYDLSLIYFPIPHGVFSNKSKHDIIPVHMTDKSLGLFDPSSRDEYRINTQMNFSFEVALTFVLVAVVFLIYDIFAQNRNEKLSASESNAIVSSLFPDIRQVKSTYLFSSP